MSVTDTEKSGDQAIIPQPVSGEPSRALSGTDSKAYSDDLATF